MHVCGACNVVCRALFTTDAPRRSIHGSAVIHTSPASNCVPHNVLMLSSTCGIATCVACTSVQYVRLRCDKRRCVATNGAALQHGAKATQCDGLPAAQSRDRCGGLHARATKRADGRGDGAAHHVATERSMLQSAQAGCSQKVTICCGAVRHVAATPEGAISCARADGGTPVGTTRA